MTLQETQSASKSKEDPTQPAVTIHEEPPAPTHVGVEVVLVDQVTIAVAATVVGDWKGCVLSRILKIR